MRPSNYLLWLLVAAAGVILLCVGKAVNEGSGKPQRGRGPQAGSGETPGSDRSDSPGGKDEVSVSAGATREVRVDTERRPAVRIAKTGAPIAGARLSISCEGPREWVHVMGVSVFRASHEVLWEGRTAEDGSFAWPKGIREGTHVVRVEAAGFAPYSQRLKFPPPPAGLAVELRPGGKLLAVGLGSPAVPVVLAAPSGAVQLRETDSRGEALFEDLEPGSYAVGIGDPQARIVARARATGERAAPRYNHSVAEGALVRVDLGDLRTSLAEVNGRVTGACGGEISLRSSGDTPHLLRAHAIADDGSFSFSFVPAGDYELVVTPALGRAVARPIRLEKAERHTVEFPFPLVAIEGIVVASGAEGPAAGVEVRLAAEAGSGELTATTDRAGAFSFAQLVPGSYRLTVRGKGPPLSRQVLVQAGAPLAPLRVSYPEP